MAGTAQSSAIYEIEIKQTASAQETLTTGPLVRGGIVLGVVLDCYSIAGGTVIQFFKRSAAGVDTSISLGGVATTALNGAPYNLAANKTIGLPAIQPLTTASFLPGESLRMTVGTAAAQFKATFICLAFDAFTINVP
jgi:hypothetical protein